MTTKPSNLYFLPKSSFYDSNYPDIVIDFDHITSVSREENYLFINKVVGYMHVRYTDEFEVELLVRDIKNKWEEYKQSV